MSARWDVYESPLGRLLLSASERGLTGLSFTGRAGEPAEDDRSPELLAPAAGQLAEYFAGERRVFELELNFAGSPFQERVWEQLLEIPFGETLSYGELARAVGRPDIVRGVAGAVGRTPIPIIIPCHRVVGADGALTGYGGGLQRKRALLDLERCGARQLSLL
ncbi:MAG TPA: methylated-DNA--[protein]-cysteine S-methyltransferase [Gaiellales bacterium]|jgi:methylated-DNA-[protein]-cysteine S-methyltransferase|nr:methylated-DNA--[protein]-cysteine S-methyltransferase [Gaiellales bacterium]